MLGNQLDGTYDQMRFLGAHVDIGDVALATRMRHAELHVTEPFVLVDVAAQVCGDPVEEKIIGTRFEKEDMDRGHARHEAAVLCGPSTV